MAGTLYLSTDTSAPTISGEVGKLIAVLDACLVNGYGSQAAAGWSKVYSGTNKAVYRAPAGNRFYLRIDDSGSDAAGAKVALAVGYETMSDVDTGTGPFPTAAQLATGVFISKSYTADTVTHPWFVLADDRSMIFGAAYYVTQPDQFGGMLSFGDLYDVSASDAYASICSGATSSANAISTTPGSSIAKGTVPQASNTGAIYAPRTITGTGSAVSLFVSGPISSNTSGSVSLSAPDASGNARVMTVKVLDGSLTSIYRGAFFGWRALHTYLNPATYPSFTGLANGRYLLNHNSCATVLDTNMR